MHIAEPTTYEEAKAAFARAEAESDALFKKYQTAYYRWLRYGRKKHLR